MAGSEGKAAGAVALGGFCSIDAIADVLGIILSALGIAYLIWQWWHDAKAKKRDRLRRTKPTTGEK